MKGNAMKRLALAVTMTVAAFLGLGHTASAQYAASASAVTSDGKTTVTYTGCADGETITFNLPGATPETATGVCSNGTATAVFTAPPSSTIGTAAGTTSPSLPFTVASLAPTPTNPPSGLPATGSSGLSTTAGVAIGLLVVGCGLLVVGQLRRRRPNAA